MDAVGDDLGATCGNIIIVVISCSIKLNLMQYWYLAIPTHVWALLVRSAFIFLFSIWKLETAVRTKCLPEETNRRIVDIISDVNMAYSEHARRYLAECGLPKERTYVTGSPMAEVLCENLAEIEASDVHQRLGLEKGNTFYSQPTVRRILTRRKNFYFSFYCY